MATKSRTALEAVKYALKLQAHGGAIGRFYVQRTIEHLQQCHDDFSDDVMEVKSNIQSSTNHAMQRFIFENIPQLKYRNKQTAFVCTMTDDLPTSLEVKFADGKNVTVNTDQSQKDIYKDMVEITKAAVEESKDFEP